MTLELDLVRHYYLAGEEPPAHELGDARAVLETAIAAEAVARRRPPRRARARRLARWGTVAAASTAACAVLVLQLVPASKGSTPIAAAAELAHLADVAQQAPTVQPGEWATYRMQGELDAHVETVGKTPTPDAKANVPLLFEVWSNSTGATCTSQQFGTASFDAPANAAAWHAIGLIDTPAHQPVTGCSGKLAATWSSPGFLDVSSLTHDPAELARGLQSGTTGIAALDHVAVGRAPGDAAFLRLTIMAVGPTSGEWSGFGPELLRTMSLIPGVVALGSRTAHSGASGPAFTVRQESSVGHTNGLLAPATEPTVILDGYSGALLEARNYDIPVLQQAAQGFVGSPDAPVFTEGVSYGVTTEWIDPVGVPSVVAGDAVPAWIAATHVIEAVTLPGTTDAALSALLDPFLGNGNMDAAESGVPTPIQQTHEITILGTPATLAHVVAVLVGSGHFASVTVEM